MKRSALVIWIVTGILLVAAIAFGLLWLVPTMSALTTAADRARDAASGLAQLEEGAVGEKFETDLRQFATQRAAQAADVMNVRARLARQRLDAPFKEMRNSEGGARPTADEFQRAYAFHGDQLKSSVRDLVGRVGGPEVRDIPLMTPPFSAGPAPDDAAIRKWQRYSNIETKCLETAARLGAPPVAAMTLEPESAPPDDSDPNYERLRISLELLCPEGKVSAIAHALIGAFDDQGVITKLAGLRDAPIPEAKLREKTAVPAKRVTITLSLGIPVLPEQG